MKICVFGLWHLGCVTAACLAQAGHSVAGLDLDEGVLDGLRSGRAPLFEPGLDVLIATGVASQRLKFSSDPAVVADCDLVWITFDTPVDDNDCADVELIESHIGRIFPHLTGGAIVLISSQLPAGSTRRIANAYQRAFPSRNCYFAYSPENLRLGKAIEVFTKAERIVVGSRNSKVREVLEPLLKPFAERTVWLSIESAEVVKHALNAFLATSVTFANEIATICERIGADAAEVEMALRLEPRIGPLAYIRPGAGFAGGTLARDVVFLNTIAADENLMLPLLGSLLASNREHQHWPVRRLIERLGSLSDRAIAVLGLAYKPGTDTLRRSWAISLCRELTELGASVRAFDPAVQALPREFADFVTLTPDIATALKGADAVIVATEWPEFKVVDPDLCRRTMSSTRVVDPNRFLTPKFEQARDIDYISVGKP